MSSSPPRTPKTRQTFTVVIGWVGVVMGVAFAVASLVSDLAWKGVCLGSAVALTSFLVLTRPFVQVRSDALVVSNVVREVTLPWEGISHATSRGSLVIHDNDGGHTTVWAIGSQKATRQENGDSAASFSVRPRTPSELVAPVKSAGALREAINAETVDNPVDVPSGKTVRWMPFQTFAMALALVLLVVGLVL